jgi:hypothetical protein
MKRSLDSILGSSLVATDGQVGKVYNVFFNDRSWAIRYLVAEAGSWFRRRKVLISPAEIGEPDWNQRAIPLKLTREQVRNSPGVNADRPVSRQQQLAMIRHYCWGDCLTMEPSVPPIGWSSPDVPFPTQEEEEDQHLRSAKEVAGYQAIGPGGALGCVTDFIIDDREWTIPDLVVKPEAPVPAGEVLLPTRWVSSVSWQDRQVELSAPIVEGAALGVTQRA